MTYSIVRGRWSSSAVCALLGAGLLLAGGACEDDGGGVAATDAGSTGDASRSDAGAGGDSSGDAPPAVTANTTCSIVKKGEPLTVAAGRQVVCALDIGSN